jgi:KaiC/GvpD/RAD55 family RecA-like ATPase
MLKIQDINVKIILFFLFLQIVKEKNDSISKMKIEEKVPKKKKNIKNKFEVVKNNKLKNTKHPDKLNITPRNKKNKTKKSKTEKVDRFHITTINKVDELIKEMEGKEKKGKRKSTFLKKILNLGQTNDTILPTPEFLSTPPFVEYDLSWLNSELKEELLNNSLEGFEDIGNCETKIGQTGLFESDAEEFEKEEYASDFVKPIISEMINPPEYKIEKCKNKEKLSKLKWIFTGIPGFDDLLVKGIPMGSNIIVAGGPGSGKTIFCLQTLYNKALEGKDCVFLSMEERPERLMDHLLEFGFKVKEIKREVNQIILKVNGKGRLSLKRLQPIKLARSIEALLEKASGTLPIDIDLVLDFFPEDFNVSLLTLDSISAIETAFSGTRRQYRIYIEQLFRYFEHLDITTLMITESTNAPHQFSNTGVEEFLADGIFVFYNFQGVKKRTRGAEIYKLRGAAHSQKIVPMEITSNGILINSEDVCREQA